MNEKPRPHDRTYNRMVERIKKASNRITSTALGGSHPDPNEYQELDEAVLALCAYRSSMDDQAVKRLVDGMAFVNEGERQGVR